MKPCYKTSVVVQWYALKSWFKREKEKVTWAWIHVSTFKPVLQVASLKTRVQKT